MTNLKQLRKILAVKPRRFWNNKLSQIVSLIDYMQSEGILNKGESKKKDSLYKGYYRYYNDGDFPAFLRDKVNRGIDSKEEIEIALENVLEEFVKSILVKYLPKTNLKDFRLSELKSKVHTLVNAINKDPLQTSSVLYFLKEIPNKSDELNSLTLKLNELDSKIGNLPVVIDKNLTSYTNSYIYEKLNNMNLLDSNTKSMFEQLRKVTYNIQDLLEAIVESASKAFLLSKGE